MLGQWPQATLEKRYGSYPSWRPSAGRRQRWFCGPAVFFTAKPSARRRNGRDRERSPFARYYLQYGYCTQENLILGHVGSIVAAAAVVVTVYVELQKWWPRTFSRRGSVGKQARRSRERDCGLEEPRASRVNKCRAH